MSLGRSLSSNSLEGVLRERSQRILTSGSSLKHIDEGSESRSVSSTDWKGQDWFAVDDVEEIKAFKAAATVGRYIEAAHELHRLEVAGVEEHIHGRFFDPVVLERVNRIASQYDCSLGMFRRSVEELEMYETEPESHLEWGFDVQGDIMQLVYSVVEPDLDIILGFAGMQERDLQMEFNPGLKSVECIGEQTPHDTIWHTFSYSKTTRTKNDLVTIISAADALDELGALWGAMYTPPSSAIEVRGLKVPPPEPDHTRAPHTFQAWSLTPLNNDGDRTRGFTLKMVLDAQLPSVASTVIRWMPGMMLKGVARARVDQISKDFRHFVAESGCLRERAKAGPRASFYSELRTRLGGQLPPATGAASTPCAATVSAADTPNARAPSPCAAATLDGSTGPPTAETVGLQAPSLREYGTPHGSAKLPAEGTGVEVRSPMGT